MHHPVPLHLMTVEQHWERLQAENAKERVKATKQAANSVVRQLREAGVSNTENYLQPVVEGRLRLYGVPRDSVPAIAKLVIEVV